MIQEFLDYLRTNRNLSENTIQAYAQDLHNFVDYCKVIGLRWSTIEQSDIEDYVSNMHEAGKAAATINRHISSIRCLFTWAQTHGLLQKNAARYVRSYKQSESLPTIADKEALMKYLDTEAKTMKSRTIHGLIALLLDTGIRIQEAIDIRKEDIDMKTMSIKIHGKGRKERKVFFTTLMMQHCCSLLDLREGYLIPIENQRTLRYWMYEELKGITKTHPHAIRHLFATSMLENGAEITAISHLLGHNSITTTQRYSHVTCNYAENQYRLYH